MASLTTWSSAGRASLMVQAGPRVVWSLVASATPFPT